MKQPSVAAILLAAGSSTRLGRPKQLLLYRGRSLIRHIAEVACASTCGETFVVLGFEAERMKDELHDLPLHFVENPEWQEGIASSIRAGIASLPQTIRATIILVCDQLLVAAQLLDLLVSTHTESGKPIVASEYGGDIGVPVLFSRSFFPDLLRLKGDQGAKQLVQQHSDLVAMVPFPGGSVDIDTEADYRGPPFSESQD